MKVGFRIMFGYVGFRHAHIVYNFKKLLMSTFKFSDSSIDKTMFFFSTGANVCDAGVVHKPQSCKTGE